MCKGCVGSYLISSVATWGFFASLLSLLKVENALVNSVWLTLLIFVAIVYCPVVNTDIAKKCKMKKR